MAAIRNGILVLLICALPTSARAGCGIFSPCGTPGWVGFSLALPIPRLPQLHTFATQSCQSPFCGAGQFGCPTGYGWGQGGYPGNPCCTPTPLIPSLAPNPSLIGPTPAFPSSSFNPCAPYATAFSQTEFVPQQTISYREVPQTQYRQEAYTASIPVTTYQPVTQFRSVPYETIARIPQISTQYVPQQRLSYLGGGPQIIASAPCAPCLSMPYGASTAALPYSSTPEAWSPTAGIPEYPYPVTQPQADAAWQTIPQRQAQQPAQVHQMGYVPSYPAYPSSQPRAFQPAPSAATAWQSRWLR